MPYTNCCILWMHVYGWLHNLLSSFISTCKSAAISKIVNYFQTSSWLIKRLSSSILSSGQLILHFYMWKQHPSHYNSVCPSVTQVDQSKTMQARITKSSPSAARKTLVSGSVKLLHKFEEVHPSEGAKWEVGEKNLQFLANKSWYLNKGAR